MADNNNDNNGDESLSVGRVVKGEDGSLEERAALRPRIAAAVAASGGGNGHHNRMFSDDGRRYSIQPAAPGDPDAPANPEVLVPEVVPIPPREFYLLFLAIAIQEAVMTADTLVTSMSVGLVVTDIGGAGLSTWLITAQIIGLLATLPLSGRLNDMYGRRKMMMIGMFGMCCAMLFCMFAWTMWFMLLGRGIAGLGAGILQGTIQVILADLVPARRRGVWLGVLAIWTYIVSSILVVSANILVDDMGWRWLFYLEIPLLGMAAFLTYVSCHIPIMPRLHSLDWPGAVTMVLAITSLSLAMTWGGNTFGWDSFPVLLLFSISGVTFILFIAIQSRTRDPILPPHVMKIWNVGIGFAASFLTSFGIIPTGYYLLQWFEIAMSYSTTTAGIHLLPLFLPLPLFVIGVGFWLKKTGIYRPLPPIGSFAVAGLIGALAFSIHTTMDYWYIATFLIFISLGAAITQLPLKIIAQNAAPPYERATVVATNTFASLLGSSVGLPFAGAIFHEVLTRKLPDAWYMLIGRTSTYIDNYFKGDADGLESFQTIYTSAIAAVFGVSALPLCIAGIITLVLKDVPLSDGHGAPVDDEANNHNHAAAAVAAQQQFYDAAAPAPLIASQQSSNNGMEGVPSPVPSSSSSVAVAPSVAPANEAKGYVAPAAVTRLYPDLDATHSD